MCQCPPVCSQALSGTGPSAPRSRRIASRRRRAASTRSSSLGSAACRLGAISELVGGAAGRRGERDDVSSKRDLEVLFPQDVADAAPPRFEPGQLLEHGRRRLAQPEELRVAVRQARAGDAALVEHDLDVREPFGRRSLAARVQDRRDGFDLALLQLGQRAGVPRRVDDDLLPLERRVEVRDDADLPARGCPVGDPGGPIAYVSGGVRSSRPSQNGHSSSSACVGSGIVGRSTPGRRARAGAIATVRPEIGSRLRSGVRSSSRRLAGSPRGTA